MCKMLEFFCMLTYLHILIACVLDSVLVYNMNTVLVYKMNTVKGLSSSKQNLKYVWSIIFM
jgi:hypothetical protein